MEENQNTSLFQLNLDAQNTYTLRSAATWAKVLGVVGMIMGILFFITGIVLQQAVNRSGDAFETYRYKGSGLSASSIGNIGLAVYVLMGLVFVISSIFALNAGKKINTGLRANDMGTLSSGFANARNYFAFWAIMIIIMLLLVLLSIMGSIGR